MAGSKIELGELYWKITAENNELKNKLKDSENSANKTGSSFKKMLSVFKGAAVVAAAVGIAKVSTALINAASDAEEVQNKFKVVFSGLGEDASQTANALADNYGLAKVEAKNLLSNTADLLNGFGLAKDASLDLSKGVQELAVDLASFQNLEGGAARASEILTKGLLGETEGLKQLGIAINQTELKRFAEENDLVFETMTKAEKAALTYELALKQSGNALGDFARSSDSFANTQRVIGASFADMTAAAGGFLLDGIKPLLPQITLMTKGVASFVEGMRPMTNEFEDQKDAMIESKFEFNARIKLLESDTATEKQRKDALEKVNTTLRTLGVAEIKQIDNLKEIGKAQREANQAFNEEIKILATKSLIQDKVNKAAKLAEKNIQDEISMSKTLARYEQIKQKLEDKTASSQDRRTFPGLKRAADRLKEQIKARQENIDLIQEEITAIKSAADIDLTTPSPISTGGGGGGTTGGGDDDDKPYETTGEDLLGGVLDGLNAVAELSSSIADRRIADLERVYNREIELINSAADAQREAIMNETISAEEKAAKLEILETNTTKKQAKLAEKLEKDRANASYKASMVEWTATLANAAAQSALALIKVQAQTGIFSAPFLVATGISTALQLAAIGAAKPQRPSFEVGTTNVPYDMTANIHKNEMIVPADFADGIRKGEVSLGGGQAGGGQSPIYLDGDMVGKWLYKAQMDGRVNTAKASIV